MWLSLAFSPRMMAYTMGWLTPIEAAAAARLDALRIMAIFSSSSCVGTLRISGLTKIFVDIVCIFTGQSKKEKLIYPNLF